MLCEHFPQIVMNALERRVWWQPSDDWRTRHDLGTESYFGIRRSSLLVFSAQSVAGAILALAQLSPRERVPVSS